MSALTVTLPGLPPSTNHRYRRGTGTALYLNRETAKWQTEAIQVFANAAARAAWQAPAKTPLVLTILFITPKLFTRDIDNMLKSLIDAAAKALAFNDAYIVQATVNKEKGAPAATRVTLEAAPTVQAQVALRMESYVPPIEGDFAFREACTAAGVTPIPDHPTKLTDSQARAVLTLLPPGGRRRWPHEVGALDRLTDALVADTLAASDAEILAEFREEGGDPAQYAASMRAQFERLAARSKDEEGQQ